jgi:hypothetical protein
MALAFAVGSLCFLIGPFPGFENAVGDVATSITFFVGSIFFTIGGGLQTWLAFAERRATIQGRAAWWTAVIQSAGTLFFNVTTFMAISTALPSADYNRLVWRPDAAGSICFLVSGTIAYWASPRRGWLPVRKGSGWWEAATNLLGCVLFGFSAIFGYVVPGSGQMVDLAAANWNTSAGAACFLACAMGTLRTGATVKILRFRPLREIERVIETEIDEIEEIA